MIRVIKSFGITLCLIFCGITYLSAQQAIVDQLKEELKKKGLHSYSVSASGINGNLLIVGSVSSQAQKDIIIETAQNIPGVTSLKEEIFVDTSYGASVYSDEEVRNNIQEALAQSSLKAPGLSVKEGNVVLSGDFSSFRTVDEISAIILSTEGVQGFSTNVTVNGKDYMEGFGGKRKESEVATKKQRCHGKKHGKKMDKAQGKEKKSCCMEKSGEK